MKKIKFLNIIWILFYIAIFFILLNNSFASLDPDFGWHLKVGEQILKEKAVPNLETYNYTLEGQTWVDHEWLINTATYWIYDNFGYITLNIVFALIVVGALIILNFLAQKYVLKEKNGIFLIVFFQTFGVLASLPHFGVRMQEITVLNFILLLLILYHYNKNKKIKILALLFPLFCFWASVHAGFLIGLFVLFFWFGIKFLEIILSRFKFFNFLDYTNKLTLKQAFIFLFFSLGAVISTLLTPYGLRLYHFLTYYQNGYYLTSISEWLPFYYLPIQYWQLLYIAFAATAMLLVIFYARKRSKKISLWEIAATILFLFLALKSKRHFPLLFIISFPLLAETFSLFFNFPKDTFLNEKWRKQFFIIKPYIIITLLVISASKLIYTNFHSNPFAYFEDTYPHATVEFLKNNPEYSNKRLFSNYDWGGYLIWTLPAKKLFIDGRLPMVPFAGHTLLEEYEEFFKKDTLKEKLDQYKINLVLISNRKSYFNLNWFEKYFLLIDEKKINTVDLDLVDHLMGSPEWRLIRSDKNSLLYAR